MSNKATDLKPLEVGDEFYLFCGIYFQGMRKIIRKTQHHLIDENGNKWTKPLTVDGEGETLRAYHSEPKTELRLYQAFIKTSYTEELRKQQTLIRELKPMLEKFCKDVVYMNSKQLEKLKTFLETYGTAKENEKRNP